jgi:tetratricopeptide (TPR) repeat protein
VGEDLQGALLGLGSTYRTLGEYEKAESTLRLGLDKFPDAKEFIVFLAMTLYNLKQHHEAMSALLRLIADDVEGVKPYQRAIRLYADDLDKTW